MDDSGNEYRRKGDRQKPLEEVACPRTGRPASLPVDRRFMPALDLVGPPPRF